MGPRARLSRRGRVILWCDRHPLRAHALTVAVGLGYLWLMLGLTTGGLP